MLEPNKVRKVNWFRFLVLPFVLLWSVLFAIVLIGAVATRATARPFQDYALGSLFIVGLIYQWVLPLGISALHFRKIRDKYPFIRISLDNPMGDPTRSGVCPLCGETPVRDKFTNNLFLMPYTFKSLRHYEKKHPEIGFYARNSRLALTAFVHSSVATFGFLAGLRNLVHLPPTTPLAEIAGSFLAPFFLIFAISWTFVAYQLLRKRGSVFEERASPHGRKRLEIVWRRPFGLVLAFSESHWNLLTHYSILLSGAMGLFATASIQFGIDGVVVSQWRPLIALLSGAWSLLLISGLTGLIVVLAHAMKAVEDRYADESRRAIGRAEKYTEIVREVQRGMQSGTGFVLDQLSGKITASGIILTVLNIGYLLTGPPVPMPFFPLYFSQFSSTILAGLLLVIRYRLQREDRKKPTP